MHHPWRAFRDLTHIRLRWAKLPSGLYGYTDHEAGVVVLAEGLTQAERRCTIAHERQHILRGPVAPAWRAREEERVDREVARLLLPDIRVVGDALAWSRDPVVAADELWVDPDTLRARLRFLHPSERHYLMRRLDESE